jgi:hypothetical protein
VIRRRHARRPVTFFSLGVVGNTGAYYALAKRSPGCKVGLSIPLQL